MFTENCIASHQGDGPSETVETTIVQSSAELIESFLKILYPTTPADTVFFLAQAKAGMNFPMASNDYSAIAEKAVALDERGDVHFAVAQHAQSTLETRTRRVASVVVLPGFWVDIDVVTGKHAEKNLPQSVEETVEFLYSLKVKPSLVVFSGGGLHAYYLFKDMLLITNEEERNSAIKLSKAFGKYVCEEGKARGWILDDVSDLARILRLPGTRNHKDPENLKLVSILEHHEDRRYSPEEFEVFLESEVVERPEASGATGDDDLLSVIPDGKRNTTLTKRAGVLNRAGFKGDRLLSELLKINQEQCSPPLPEKEVQAIAKSVGKYTNGANEKNASIELTDLGNARRLVERFGDQIRYCGPWNKWMVWDGKRWKRDDTGELERMAKEITEYILKEAINCKDSSSSNLLFNHAIRSQASNKIRATIDVAKTESRVAARPEDFDKDMYLFNCENGILDLRTGELLPHNPRWLITRVSPVTFDPLADCSKFLKFIERIFSNDIELIEYMRDIVGYSLSGDISDQSFYYLYGLGANGKSVFLEIIRFLMGEYGKQSDFETFNTKSGDKVRNDLAMLKGARFVTAPEVDGGKALSESVIKQVTGGEPISARFLFAEYFEYKPEFKLFMAANHKLEIKNQDHGIWRRVKMIPFKVTIPEDERDNHLTEKLKLELSGILNWAIQGFNHWNKGLMKVPKSVLEATQGYKHDMDIVGEFIESKCKVGPDETVRVSTLYESYKDWCKYNNEMLLGKIQFGARLSQLGYEKGRDREAYHWNGIGLNN